MFFLQIFTSNNIYLFFFLEPKPVPPPVVEPTTPAPWVLHQTAPVPQPVAPPVIQQSIPPQPVAPPIPTPVPEVQSVFPSTHNIGNLDISNIVTQRLNAMRKLQDNPNDYEAQSLLNSAQKDVGFFLFFSF